MAIDKENDVAETLRMKGLSCVCQLCDCGRPHKHKGCKIPHPTVAVTFDEGNTEKNMSDYKARFPAYHPPQPARPIYQQQELEPTDPALPMDLNTVQQTSYTKFSEVAKRKPCKLKGEIEKFMSGDFEGKTSYKDSFVGYRQPALRTARPQTVFNTDNGVPFVKETEYRKGFQEKPNVRQGPIREKAEHTYGLLYPNHGETLPRISLKNSIHDGRTAEKVRPCDMKKSNVDFGLQGEFDHTTTNGVHFKEYDAASARAKPKRRSDQEKMTGKFDAVSQNQSDFVYNGSEAAQARGKKVTEHPSLIQLSMDVSQDFQTVSNLSYNWKAENFKRPMCPNKPTAQYVPPKDKFDCDSHTHTDFINYGAISRAEIIHPPEMQKSSAKVSSKSTYKEAFKSGATSRRQVHGEPVPTNLRLPSADRKFDASSTMRSDFTTLKSEKRKPFKPTCATHTNDGLVSKRTEYNETFLAKQNERCLFNEFLLKQNKANERSQNAEIATT